MKTTNPANKKFNQLFSTDEAKDIYKTLYSLEQDYIARALEKLDAAEKIALGKLLTKIDSAL
jgi:DNA-binding MarR family transcriptional regulator